MRLQYSLLDSKSVSKDAGLIFEHSRISRLDYRMFSQSTKNFNKKNIGIFFLEKNHTSAEISISLYWCRKWRTESIELHSTASDLFPTYRVRNKIK